MVAHTITNNLGKDCYYVIKNLTAEKKRRKKKKKRFLDPLIEAKLILDGRKRTFEIENPENVEVTVLTYVDQKTFDLRGDLEIKADGTLELKEPVNPEVAGLKAQLVKLSKENERLKEMIETASNSSATSKPSKSKKLVIQQKNDEAHLNEVAKWFGDNGKGKTPEKSSEKKKLASKPKSEGKPKPAKERSPKLAASSEKTTKERGPAASVSSAKAKAKPQQPDQRPQKEKKKTKTSEKPKSKSPEKPKEGKNGIIPQKEKGRAKKQKGAADKKVKPSVMEKKEVPEERNISPGPEDPKLEICSLEDTSSCESRVEREIFVAAEQGAELIQCVKLGDLARISQLIKEGAYLNWSDQTSHTALMWASIYDQHEAVHLLVANGANTRKKLPGGDEAIHLACKWGHTRIIESLLQASVPVNVRGFEGRTPLMYAALSGKHESVKLLLKHGAKKDLANEKMKRAIDFARSYSINRDLMD